MPIDIKVYYVLVLYNMVHKIYTIVDHTSLTGRYTGSCPSQAAKKMISHLSRFLSRENRHSPFIFKFRQINNANKDIIYTYEGRIIRHNNPRQVRIKGRIITYNFFSKCTFIEKNEICKTAENPKYNMCEYDKFTQYDGNDSIEITI